MNSMRNGRRAAVGCVRPIWLVACWIAVSGCSGKTTLSDGSADASAANPATGGTGSGGEPASASAGRAPVVVGGGAGDASTSLAGSNGSGESTGFGGSPGNRVAAGGAGGVIGMPPLCMSLFTNAGSAPTKGGACEPTDPQFCYKTCGPQSIGFKTETCSSGVYWEGACQFALGGDYSCYAIPPTLDPACPAEPPQAGTACDVPACAPCNAAGIYLDSTGAPKAGYCVCVPGIVQRWSCALAISWPCPGSGC